MKTSLRKIVVLASLAGVAASAYGQEIAAQPAPVTPTAVQAVSESAPRAYASNIAASPFVDPSSARSTGLWIGAQTVQTVFVVPGPGLPEAGRAAITEDMAVMCRILDKLMAQAALVGDMAGTVDPFGRASDGSYTQTQGVYLDGYGALFYMEVGFPLAPGVQGQDQAKAETSTDTLWSQTADEVRGVTRNENAPSVQEYDAQKVENLKQVLTKSFRHAANLRTHGPQDALTLIVASRSRRGSGPYGIPLTEPPATDSPNVLVFRTAKPDVDAFAEGSLTLEQFTAKVKLLSSWTSDVTQGVGSTGKVQRSSGVSIGARQ